MCFSKIQIYLQRLLTSDSLDPLKVILDLNLAKAWVYAGELMAFIKNLRMSVFTLKWVEQHAGVTEKAKCKLNGRFYEAKTLIVSLHKK